MGMGYKKNPSNNIHVCQIVQSMLNSQATCTFKLNEMNLDKYCSDIQEDSKYETACTCTNT